ncbi:MAG: penicillin-insensitive murein endopeptidase [Myxococcota bacterium]
MVSDSQLECAIHGRLVGDATGDTVLSIGPAGHVVGNVSAPILIVAGTIRGNVRARLLLVRATGVIEGDVAYERISVDDGASIIGRVGRPSLDDLPVVPRPAELTPPLRHTPAPTARARPQPVDVTPPTGPTPSPTPELRPPPSQHPASESAEVFVLEPGRRRPPSRATGRRSVRMGKQWFVAAAASMLTVTPLHADGPKAKAAKADVEVVESSSASPSLLALPSIPFLRPPTDDSEVVEASPAMDVAWTLDKAANLRMMSFRWGLPESELAQLNPQLERRTMYPAGTEVWVFRSDPEAITRSLGYPNRGSLVHGIPMPQSEHWTMRGGRRRVYGTATTIATLSNAFAAYAAQFPDADPIRLGDISARRGKHISPHQSHQSGRDVDIAYVRLAPPTGKRRGMWQTAVENLDATRTWFLVRTLIDSGVVQSIFVNQEVQRPIREAALADLPAAEVDEYMEFLSHEDGHKGHMHVRFLCEHGNLQCRPHSLPTPTTSRAAQSPEAGLADDGD